MVAVGIDSIGFYTPNFYLDMEDFANERGVDISKLHTGLGQYKMSVPAPDEDIVTMGANAAKKALKDTDLDGVTTVFFATESGVDQSKAAGIYIHSLLGLSEFCRVVELKQACYSSTAALQMSMAILYQQPEKKILLIASDIARYGLGTTGESSQGAGAVAMLLSSNPRLVQIEPGSGFHTQDAMDFWRPNYSDEAMVNGKHSIDLYLSVLKKSWERYSCVTGRVYDDHDYFLYHIPMPKLAQKAHQRLAMINKSGKNRGQLVNEIDTSLKYSSEVGNCYTASLYLGLISLLDNSQKKILENKRIGLYSYGSGCVGEFFSGIIQKNYDKFVQAESNNNMIIERRRLSMTEYENFYNFSLPTDGSNIVIPKYTSGNFRLSGLNNHKRIYSKMSYNASLG